MNGTRVSWWVWMGIRNCDDTTVKGANLWFRSFLSTIRSRGARSNGVRFDRCLKIAGRKTQWYRCKWISRQSTAGKTLISHCADVRELATELGARLPILSWPLITSVAQNSKNIPQNKN